MTFDADSKPSGAAARPLPERRRSPVAATAVVVAIVIVASIALANIIPERAVAVLLDERGDNPGSAKFAEQLAKWRAAGVPALVFIIGGADGLAASLRDKAKMKLAFGAATWPHQLVRAMLLEQLYRAATILTGHPYHRV